MWKMKSSYENGAKKMYESYSATKIFLKFEMLCHEWRHFKYAKVNTDKTSVTRVIPKTFHCLIFAFRATNAVLDPDRAQPSWRLWPQERPLLKLSVLKTWLTKERKGSWDGLKKLHGITNTFWIPVPGSDSDCSWGITLAWRVAKASSNNRWQKV